MAIRWHKRDPEIWTSDTERVFSSYSQRSHPVIFRIDGRNKRREGYRVDRGGLMGWEAIDGGQGFKSVREARAHVERYLAAMKEQETLDPRTERRNLGVRDRSRRLRRRSY